MTRQNDNLEQFEAQVESALAGLIPAMTFEDRMSERLRRSAQRLRMPHVSPLVLRSAIGVAATLAVAAIGFVAMDRLDPAGHELAATSTLAGKTTWNYPGTPSEPRLELSTSANESSVNRYGAAEYQSSLFKGVQRDNTETARVPMQRQLERFGRDRSSIDFDDKDGASKAVADERRAGVVVADNEPLAFKVTPYFEQQKLGYAVQPTVSAGDLVVDGKLSTDTGRRIENEGVVVGAEARPTEIPALSTATPAPEAPADRPSIVIQNDQKIIRTGNIEFEVQSFDASFTTLSTIVAEEAGMIGSTESTKLENGKTRGTIVVRVPPENLDRLITKLRGLGELKTQSISAQDVTKHYTDIESQLRAAQAMQDRLIQIIKEGKGAIKDLLAAEKELGNWRTRIEQLEGERRFIDSQVAMSTLSITLTETNIAQAATVTRSETVSAGVECEDVEKARTEILARIDELGGRVLSADLKQLDAGQFNATIVAEVKSESSGLLIDRLKQAGRIARLTAERAEKSSEGSVSPTTAPKVETRPSVFQISLYNLANIAPRVTQTITLATKDVEGTYRLLIGEANRIGAKVVTGEMNRPRPDAVGASIRIDVPSADADAFAAKLSSLGVVMASTDSQSTDNTNVTAAKRGFSLSLIDVVTVPPRENVNAMVRVESAGNALTTVLASVQQASGKVISQSHRKDADGRDSASATVEVPASASPTILQSLHALGKVESIASGQDPNVPAGELARARYEIQLATADAIAPRDGFWNSVRNGLAISLRGLGYSLQLIIVGLCLVAPWALLVWLGVRLRRGMKLKATATPAR